jgi:class 3 adenylate cyclase
LLAVIILYQLIQKIMLSESQIPLRYKSIIQEQLNIYKQGTSITVHNFIPNTTEIPIGNPNHWLRIPGVICVFVDMKGSTKLSAAKHDRTTAGAYQLFTGTAVRLFHEFETPYIDVKGDGVFALFNSNQVYRAISAAVTFKTFVSKVFVPTIKSKTGVDVGGHYGIDQKTVLVRKIGLRRHGDRTDRQNEVWAGKPINMASKLAAMAGDGEILVSDRYFNRLKSELVLKSCGCSSGLKSDLWTKIDVDDPKFDFKTIYSLKSDWCSTHGSLFCSSMLKLDDE